MLSLTPARCTKPVAARARLPGKGQLVRPTLKQRFHASSSDSTGSSAADEVQQASSTGAAVIAVDQQRSDEGMYLDPLVRSLLLGVGAGIVCEAGHVIFKVGEEGRQKGGNGSILNRICWIRIDSMEAAVACICALHAMPVPCSSAFAPLRTLFLLTRPPSLCYAGGVDA